MQQVAEREWDILLDWLRTTGLEPSDIVQAVEDYRAVLRETCLGDMDRERQKIFGLEYENKFFQGGLIPCAPSKPPRDWTSIWDDRACRALETGWIPYENREGIRLFYLYEKGETHSQMLAAYAKNQRPDPRSEAP